MKNTIAHIETVSGESQTDFNDTLALTIQRLQFDNMDVEVQFSTSQNTHTKKNTSLTISNTVYSALVVGRKKDEPVSTDGEDVEIITDAELITE